MSSLFNGTQHPLVPQIQGGESQECQILLIGQVRCGLGFTVFWGLLYSVHVETSRVCVFAELHAADTYFSQV